MRHLLLSLIIAIPGYLFSQALTPQNNQPLSIGETFEIKSHALNELRTINVYLPLDYHPDSNQRYPVIYLLDGSMDEDFIHISGIAQFCAFPWIDSHPKSIVVGISNIDRQRDFTFPSTDSIDIRELPTSGGSEAFIDFISKELIPTIHATYLTTEHSTIIGQSLGGLLATEILFNTPDLFDDYIIVSPSLWWSKFQLLKSPNITVSKKVKHIYISVGKEGETMELCAAKLYEELTKMNLSNYQLQFETLEDKTHGDALHISVYQAFEFIK